MRQLAERHDFTAVGVGAPGYVAADRARVLFAPNVAWVDVDVKGDLEGELGAARRLERASKVGESVRAKLLVNTLVEAAQGQRRELGLPAVERLPADTVAADVAEEGARTSSGRRSLPVDDPALLEELLRLPRAHLVIDGYNVTKTTWPELPLERQRDRLITGVAALLARTGAEMTIVFDAAETKAT